MQVKRKNHTKITHVFQSLCEERGKWEVVGEMFALKREVKFSPAARVRDFLSSRKLRLRIVSRIVDWNSSLSSMSEIEKETSNDIHSNRKWQDGSLK